MIGWCGIPNQIFNVILINYIFVLGLQIPSNINGNVQKYNVIRDSITINVDRCT